MSDVLARWTGVVLTLIGVAAVVALTLSGQLGLYIHPRYHLFTIGMCVFGGVIALAAIAFAPGNDHAGHDHGPRSHRGRRGLGALIRVLVIVVAAGCLLVLPPASLTGTTLQKRDVASPTRISSGTDLTSLVGADPSTFTVKDWAGLLAQGGSSAVLDRPVQVSAYVLDRDDDTVFYAVRMLVTCCAVDGQPVGVPVRIPNWRGQLEPGQWVELSGRFVENPDTGSRYPTVVDVDRIDKITEPEQPYVF